MLTRQDVPLSLTVTSAWDARHVASAAAGIEQVLAEHTAPLARLTRCRMILAGLGEDMTGRDWPARLLAFLFRFRAGPFTLAVHRLTGERPVVETIPGTEREYRLTAAELHALAVIAEDDLYGWERWGWMRVGGLDVAKVWLRIVPARIGGWDSDAFTRIRKGEPCGQVLPGLTRADRGGTSVWPCDPAVIGAASLRTVTGTPFGFAGEQVTAALCGRLSGSC